jgi:hypothetical protein
MATLMLKDYFRRRTTLSGRARTTMDQEPIANAIKTLTDHIRHHSHNTAWDIRHVPTPIEIKARKDAIEATCKKLDALGQHPDARFPDFKFLRHKLNSHHFQCSLIFMPWWTRFKKPADWTRSKRNSPAATAGGPRNRAPDRSPMSCAAAKLPRQHAARLRPVNRQPRRRPGDEPDRIAVDRDRLMAAQVR